VPRTRVAMQVLWHSQIAITTNVYSDVSSAETRTACGASANRLQGGWPEVLLLYFAAVLGRFEDNPDGEGCP